ncbi:hypothetical protein FC24_GL000887 [Loigolactobacillus rennini DSM 20253]|uniref:Uncharacterized protein n=2 Tax=Loigolactobacillus rennini TaxID=238013 RepID=A0A0R2CMZ3_9LACO|nr:hypothetical protein FC24_GL000887 [Loigolactobacillus rennini DSM 20253]
MTMQKINFGEQNWDKPLSANLADLYAGGAISDTGWIDCGTLINGARVYNGDDKFKVKRKVIDFGKFKLVKINGQVEISGTDLDWNHLSDTPIVTLPTDLPPLREINKVLPSSGRSLVRWKLTADGQTARIIYIMLDNRMKPNEILWLPIEFNYISQ